MCCTSCCPCCAGDGTADIFTAAWAHKVFEAWFKTFVGLTSIACFIMFIIEQALSPHDKNVNGYTSLDPDTLHMLGSKDTAAIVLRFEIWRLVTCVFLHGGWSHLLSNMFVQMTQGWLLETGQDVVGTTLARSPHRNEWGFSRTALIYSTCAISASLLGCVCAPHADCVGASGAIMGLIGAKAAWLFFNWEREDPFKVKLDACFTAFWVMLIFLVGWSNPLVDNWGHLGGLLSGILLGGFLFAEESYDALEGSGQTLTFMQKSSATICATLLGSFNLILIGILLFVTRPALQS